MIKQVIKQLIEHQELTDQDRIELAQAILVSVGKIGKPVRSKVGVNAAEFLAPRKRRKVNMSNQMLVFMNILLNAGEKTASSSEVKQQLKSQGLVTKDHEYTRIVNYLTKNGLIVSSGIKRGTRYTLTTAGEQQLSTTTSPAQVQEQTAST